MKNNTNGSGELKTADVRELHAGKSSSSPTNSSRDQNSEASIPSLRSVIRSPQAHKTCKSPSVVDVGLDSSQNSSAAASDFTDQNSTAVVISSQGNVHVIVSVAEFECYIPASVFTATEDLRLLTFLQLITLHNSDYLLHFAFSYLHSDHWLHSGDAESLIFVGFRL